MNRIVTFGLMAGLIVAVPMFAMIALNPDPHNTTSSQIVGFSLMFVALSLVFVGVKSHRDKALGGVIKFGPALLVGLGISAVAAVIYVIGWEITLALTNYTYADTYAQGIIDAARDKGATAAEIEKLTVDMAAFQKQYANPLFRVPVTFIEIFPVGVIISLISAAVLRNPRVLPARAAVA
jgi:hypothetical protein